MIALLQMPGRLPYLQAQWQFCLSSGPLLDQACWQQDPLRMYNGGPTSMCTIFSRGKKLFNSEQDKDSQLVPLALFRRPFHDSRTNLLILVQYKGSSYFKKVFAIVVLKNIKHSKTTWLRRLTSICSHYIKSCLISGPIKSALRKLFFQHCEHCLMLLHLHRCLK